MACLQPVKGYRGPGGVVRFSASGAWSDLTVQVPCGQCIGCRLDKSKMWAARCLHEASLHDRNCFVTLTYNDNCLPANGSLVLRDFQLFMKRLRKRFGKDIRFFHCGEYGENLGRPHYHALLFNHDFEDRVLWKKTRDVPLYVSAALAELWPLGFSTVGDVTYESAAYTARYIMKKVGGQMAEKHYSTIDPDTGEVTTKKAEYTTMSRRPGLGKGWYYKYRNDLWPDDFLVVRGRKTRIPKFYDNLFKVEHEPGHEQVKRQRIRKSAKHKDNNTPERLKVREKVLKARTKNLKRSLDE